MITTTASLGLYVAVMGVATRRLPIHRRIETILVLAMLVGAGTGAVIGLVTAVWTSLVIKSVAGWSGFEMVVGAVLGLAVGVPTGIVWVVLARPEHEELVGARWAAALTAAAAVVAVSRALLPAVGAFSLTCAAVAAVVAYGCAPRLGVWRSVPAPPG